MSEQRRRKNSEWRVAVDLTAALSPTGRERQQTGSVPVRSRQEPTGTDSSCCLPCGYREKMSTANVVQIPSCESGLGIGCFTKPLSENASLHARTKAILGEDQGKNNQYLLPTNILSFGNSIGLGALRFPGGFAALNLRLLPGGFCYLVGFCELEISLPP